MTTGSGALRIFDILYVEQYMAACLLMPLALNQQLTAEDQAIRMRRAKIARFSVLVIFWVTLSAWFIYSCVTGKVICRQLIYFIDLLNQSIFVFSLVKIKRQLAMLETNDGKNLLANNRMLNAYIATNIVMFLTCITQLVLLFNSFDQTTQE